MTALRVLHNAKGGDSALLRMQNLTSRAGQHHRGPADGGLMAALHVMLDEAKAGGSASVVVHCPCPAQDNTIADRPMMELLAALRVMLDDARARAGSSGPHGGALQQLVLVLADGRFHEKEALRRAVQVRAPLPCARGCG